MSLETRHIALNILDINKRIEELHIELEALHEMRENLIEDLGKENIQ